MAGQEDATATLRGATILVTGASGFVGGHVARRLALEEGAAVRALVRMPAGPTVVDLDVPGVQVVVGDLTAPASLQAAAEGVDLVVHAAADMRLRRPRVTQAVTVEGTRQMLLAARYSGVRAFVHISSIAVYGGGARGDEAAPLVPYGDRYGDAKIGAEQALRQEGCASPRVIVLRPPSIYGPGSSMWTTTLAGLVARGLPACLDGGRGMFPYVYIDNLVDTVVAALRTASIGAAPVAELGTNKAGECLVYNVVDGTTTWAKYLGYFAATYRRPVRSLPSWPFYALALAAEGLGVLLGFRPLLNRANLRYATLRILPSYTAERAHQELGWQPRINLDQGMARSLEWLASTGHS